MVTIFVVDHKDIIDLIVPNLPYYAHSNIIFKIYIVVVDHKDIIDLIVPNLPYICQ